MRRVYALLILSILIVLSGGYAEASSCTVGDTGDYADVSTALSNGCRALTFVSDVVEKQSIYVKGPGNISIDGDGFTWILEIPVGVRVQFSMLDMVSIKNLTIVSRSTVQITYNIVFNDTDVQLSSVRVYENGSHWTYFIVFNSFNNSMMVRSLTGVGNGFGHLIDIRYSGLGFIPKPPYSYANVVVDGLNASNFGRIIVSFEEIPGRINDLNLTVRNLIASNIRFVVYWIRLYGDYTLLLENHVVRDSWYLGWFRGIDSTIVVDKLSITDSGGGFLIYNLWSGPLKISIRGASFENIIGTGLFAFSIGYQKTYLNISITDYRQVGGVFGIYVRGIGLSILDVDFRSHVLEQVRYGLSVVVEDYFNVYMDRINSTASDGTDVFLADMRDLNQPSKAVLNRMILDSPEANPNIMVYEATSSPGNEMNIIVVESYAPLIEVRTGAVNLSIIETVVDENYLIENTPSTATVYLRWSLGVMVSSVYTGLPVAGYEIRFYFQGAAVALVQSSWSGLAIYTYEWYLGDTGYLPGIAFEDVENSRIYFLVSDYGVYEVIANYPSLPYSTSYTMPYWFMNPHIQVEEVSLQAIGFAHNMGAATLVLRGEVGLLIGMYSEIPVERNGYTSHSHNPHPKNGFNGLYSRIVVLDTHTSEKYAVLHVLIEFHGTYVPTSIMIFFPERLVWIPGPIDFRGRY